MSRGKELAKNTVIMLIGKIFTQFLSFLLLPIYTRLIPTDEYGAIDLIMSYVVIIAPVLTIELEMATFRFLIDSRKDEAKQASILRTAFKDLSVRLSFIVAAYLIVVQFIDFNYKYLALLCGVAACFSSLMLQIARGLGENAKYTLGSVLAGVITIASNLILICGLKMGGVSILISMIVANVVSSIFMATSLGLAKRMRGGASSKSLSNEMLMYSWPLVPNSLSWWMINSSDRTIVSVVLGTAANGIYAVANKFPTIVSGFIGVFSYSWTESASLHINDSDRDEYFSKVANTSMRLFSSIGLLVIAAMPLVFNIIVGDSYAEAYLYIPIAVIAVVLNSMVLVYSAVYVAKKLTKKVAATSIASAIINIAVDLTLVWFIGIYAAVISTAVAYLAMMIYRHFDVKKYVNIKYRASDIILAILGFVIVSVLYYLGNFYGFVAGAVFAMVYAIIMNRRIVGKVTKKIIRKR